MELKALIFVVATLILPTTPVSAQALDADTAYYEQLGNITAFTANPDRADFGIRLAASHIFSSVEAATITDFPYERPDSLFHKTGLQPPDTVSAEVEALLKRLGQEVSSLPRSAFVPRDMTSREAMRSARDILLASGYTLNAENIMMRPDGTRPATIEVLTREDQYQNELHHFVERFQKIGVRVIVSKSGPFEFVTRLKDRDYSFLVSSFPQLRTAKGFSDFLEKNGKYSLASAILDARTAKDFAIASRAAEYSLVMSNYELIPLLFLPREGGISAEQAGTQNEIYFSRLTAAATERSKKVMEAEYTPWTSEQRDNILILKYGGSASIRAEVQDEPRNGSVSLRYVCRPGSPESPSRTSLQVTFYSPDLPKIFFLGGHEMAGNLQFGIENPEKRHSKTLGVSGAPFLANERGLTVKITKKPAKDIFTFTTYITPLAMNDDSFFKDFILLHQINADLNMSYAAGAGSHMIFNINDIIQKKTLISARVTANGSTQAVTEFWRKCSKGKYIAPIP